MMDESFFNSLRELRNANLSLSIGPVQAYKIKYQ